MQRGTWIPSLRRNGNVMYDTVPPGPKVRTLLLRVAMPITLLFKLQLGREILVLAW